MFRNNIAFKGICTLILFITMGISQVELTIGNPAFDINTCSDPSITVASEGSPSLAQAACEASGTAYWTIFTLDIFMTNTAGCSYCPVSTYNNNTQDWVDQKELCESPDSGGDTTWVSYEDITKEECAAVPSLTDAGGWWFDGGVAGFNFYLDGIEVAGVSGGTAEQYLDFIDFSASTNKVVGVSMTGGTYNR